MGLYRNPHPVFNQSFFPASNQALRLVEDFYPNPDSYRDGTVSKNYVGLIGFEPTYPCGTGFTVQPNSPTLVHPHIKPTRVINRTC